MVKRAGDLVKEANASISAVTVDEAREMVGKGDVVFIDVREPAEVAKGKIPGAVHVPRGLLEFAADPESPMHNPALAPDKPTVVYCASGGRGALATKTLADMGYARPQNLKGGFTGWKDAGGDVEEQG